MERADPKSFGYKTSARLVSGEDGDSKVLQDRLQYEPPLSSNEQDLSQMRDSIEEDIGDDEPNHLARL